MVLRHIAKGTPTPCHKSHKSHNSKANKADKSKNKLIANTRVWHPRCYFEYRAFLS